MTTWKRAILFALVFVVFYGAVYYVVETQIVYRDPQHNRIYKVKTAEHSSYDYLILGSSHGLPLSFKDMDQQLETMTNSRVLNLSTPGGGVVPNWLMYAYASSQLDIKNVLYIVDSFAFYERKWNEERLGTMNLFERAPFDFAVVPILLSMNVERLASPTVTAKYLTGFPKINNPHTFTSVITQMEGWFDREYEPSEEELVDRIERLYPETINEEAFARYRDLFGDLISRIQDDGSSVIAVKPPLPDSFYERIPQENRFNEQMTQLLAELNVAFHNFTDTINEQRFYLDTDHLNRQGVTKFFEDSLAELLRQ